MRIPVTLIDSVMDAALSTDRQHCALRLCDADGQEFTLGMPVSQLGPLIERSVQILTEYGRDGHDIDTKLIGTGALLRAQRWNIQRGLDGSQVLVLTLEASGKLAFALPPEAAADPGVPLAKHAAEVGFGWISD